MVTILCFLTLVSLVLSHGVLGAHATQADPSMGHLSVFVFLINKEATSRAPSFFMLTLQFSRQNGCLT